MGQKQKNNSLLPETLERQIDRYLDVLEAYNKKLPNPRNKKNFPFLRHFFKRFVADQNARAQEVDSTSYEKVKVVANSQFPAKTYWNLCIDGRVLTILAHGASAGVGSSIRIPGGILREFVRGKDGRLHLKKDSDFVMLVMRALAKTSTIVEVFDSHLECAARWTEEQLKGRAPKDGGLLADVSHKLQMAWATTHFVDETFHGRKRVIPILTAFDPHTGFMYMGLETEGAFAFAFKNGRAFTDNVIGQLIAKGTVISTEALVADARIERVFDRYAFPLDWRHNYLKSARLFWEGIQQMKRAVVPIVVQHIRRVYSHLDSSNREKRIELEERAILLLTNAFSAYLHHDTPYPYGVHREEGIKVSEGGFPPYTISMFAVFSFEEKNLPGHIELSSSLVRKNRAEGRVKDASGIFTDPQKFAEAALPLVVQEIVRDDLSKKAWESLLAIEWRDVPEDWDVMSDDSFLSYVHEKGNIHFGVAIALNNLRKRMAALYDPYNALSSRLIEQYKVAFPVITSKSRRIWMLVPFVKLGFS